MERQNLFVYRVEYSFHFSRISVKVLDLRLKVESMEIGKSIHVAESSGELPSDYESLRALLLSRRESMPKRLKQLAAFALEHPEEVAFGTVAGIAEHAGVQPSTLVRFAKSLGYDGFSHLQQIFRDRLRERFPDYRERLKVLRDLEGDHVHAASLLEGFAGAAAISLEKMRGSVRPEELSRAIETLARADTIYLLGARRVFPIAAYCAYAFGKLGVRAILIDHVGQLGAEQLGTATQRDAVLAISFTPYAPVTADLAASAARTGIPVVAITDSAFSPLVSSADVWLEVAEADFGAFRSLSASFALAMALAVGTAEKRAED